MYLCVMEVHRLPPINVATINFIVRWIVVPTSGPVMNCMVLFLGGIFSSVALSCSSRSIVLKFRYAAVYGLLFITLDIIANTGDKQLAFSAARALYLLH